MKSARGTYVALRVLGGADRYLDNYIQANAIPPVGAPAGARRHTTVIYSRVWAPVEPCGDQLHQAIGRELKVFPQQDGRQCLVLVLDAPTVVARHEELMKRHPTLTYDFERYIPHVTLSYDIGAFDASRLTLPYFSCVLGDEYVEDLDLEWKNG